MSRGGSLPVLRHRGFAAFFAAASISNAAAWMQLIAVPALLFDLTGKATWLGVSSMVTLLPQVLITPYAGVLSDRVSRRAILLVTQTLSMVVTFALWGMYVTDRLTPWWILFLGFLAGVCGGFQNSTWQAFIPLLVPREEMLDAVKLNSVQFTLARALGPAVAGLVLVRWGSGVAIFANGVTYLLVIVVLVVVEPRETPMMAPDTKVFQALREGASFVWGNLPYRVALLIAFFGAVFGQSIQHQSAAISRRIFGHSSKDSAWLLTALGVGALVAFLCWTVFGERLSRSRQVFLGLSCYLTSVVVVATAHSYAVGLIGYFIGGVAHLTTVVGLNTLIQGSVPDEMRGRVLSFHLVAIIGGIPVGAFLLGRFGDAFGLRWGLAGDAALLSVVVGALILSGWFSSLDVTTMGGVRREAGGVSEERGRTGGSTAPAR